MRAITNVFLIEQLKIGGLPGSLNLLVSARTPFRPRRPVRLRGPLGGYGVTTTVPIMFSVSSWKMQ
jgi:hypothetical protein